MALLKLQRVFVYVCERTSLFYQVLVAKKLYPKPSWAQNLLLLMLQFFLRWRLLFTHENRGFHSQVSMVTETSVNVLVTPGLLSFSLSPGADGSVKVLFGNWDEEDQTEIGNKIGLRNAKTGSICSHVEALKCQFKCSRTTVSSEVGLMYFLICLYLWFAISLFVCC